MNEELVAWSPEQMVEVKFDDYDDFLKIRETLTRLGIPSKKEQILYQSCHILHKRQKYYIVHFKELFGLDGKTINLSETDIGRRNTIISLLERWGLLDVITPAQIAEPTVPIRNIRIISFRDKNNWKLEPKYNIGKVH